MLLMMSGPRYFAADEGNPQDHGYTPTHYVAVFAEVSGATSDEEDMGATAWTNAADPETPTTLGTAMARLVGGNVAECGPGTYVGTATTDNWDPCWHPVNHGSEGNPIIIVASVPAATNPDSEELLSKLSNGSTADGDGAVYGGRGSAGALDNHDVIWDGFWVDQLDGGFPQSSNGQAVISEGCERVYIRRGLFDRSTLSGGDNFAAIFAQFCTDCFIQDCLFRGGTSYNPGVTEPSHNNAAVSWYGVENLTVEYCQTAVNPNDSNRTVGCAQYVKAFQSGRGNSGVIRYCRFVEGMEGNSLGVEINATQAADGGVEMHHTIIQGGSHAFSIDNATDGDKTINVHHCTLVDSVRSVSGDTAGVVVCDPVTNDDEVTFRNNIVVHLADTDLDHGLVLTVGFDLNQCAVWDYNCYFHAGASARFRDDPTNYSSLATWQSLWSPAEANSIYDDPEFVDYANGDFRLASNGQGALTGSSTGGQMGAYEGGVEPGVRASPSY